jgi:hypothetical protein
MTSQSIWAPVPPAARPPATAYEGHAAPPGPAPGFINMLELERVAAVSMYLTHP